MPPPNSATPTPPANPSTSPFLELEALAGPVPDLASTLTTTQAEQDANDDNVSFLRSPMPQSDLGGNSSRDRLYREQLRREREYRLAQHHRGSESQRRMHMGAASNERRYSPSELRELQDRALSLTQRSSSGYQGWAPQDGRSDSENQHGLPTMSRSSAEFYDDHRRALVSFARHLESSNRDSPTSGARASAASQTPESLRTAALLQSVRNSHLSARSRSVMQNHLLERERSGLESTTSRDQYSTSDQRRRSALGSRSGRQRDHSPSSTSSTLHDQARRDWIMNGTHRQQEEEELQRRQEGSSWHLEDAIKYLERLRFCDSSEASLSSATAGAFTKEELLNTNHDDFISDTAMIDPPAQSSWLKIGGVFRGSQHATNESSHLVRNRSGARGSRHTDLPQLGQAQTLPTNRHSFSYSLSNPATRSSGTYSRNRAQLGFFENVDEASPQFRTLPLNSAAERSLVQSSSANPPGECWPVQVKIHSIDYETMTLAGTMEAFNVPDENSETSKSSITTFLEGEIIDFNKFTLKTKSYKTDENTDSIYWRMLEPFKKLTDDEMVRGLLSKRWMREQLRERYILMRWKEKCFVKPMDAYGSLTISGFYYVSMQRSDGRIESLYYDPQSPPFQHLSMMPESKRQFPSYQFT
ncbi:MAG: hypothetical protein LQ339_007096 [Xanthoria mediterranea]|nr:MAG: hypothetical protein LQ339_007096 [Xanthoria mediterranea]